MINIPDLLKKQQLLESDFFKMEGKTIIKRTGMDKLEKKYKVFVRVESLNVTPYGNAVHVTMLGSGKVKDGDEVRAIGEANPDNCKWSYYSSMAYKRLRHKIILMSLELYEHDVYSEDESEDFRPVNAKTQMSKIEEDVMKKVKKADERIA